MTNRLSKRVYNDKPHSRRLQVHSRKTNQTTVHVNAIAILRVLIRVMKGDTYATGAK